MDAYSEEALGLLREAEERILHAAESDGPASLVLAVDALRLTLLAINEPTADVEALREARWMRVELFGHHVTHGLVGEVYRYGRRWIEVTWPEVVGPEPDGPGEAERFPEHSKLYHPNAVYGMHEVSEDVGMERVRYQSGIPNPDDDIGF